jgi:hypothetical protein
MRVGEPVKSRTRRTLLPGPFPAGCTGDLSHGEWRYTHPPSAKKRPALSSPKQDLGFEK